MYSIVNIINNMLQKYEKTRETQKKTDFFFSLCTLFCNFADMKVTIYEHAKQLPPLMEGSYFHSPRFMALCEQTEGERPYMAVAIANDGTPIAHLLAVEHKRSGWLPRFMHSHLRIMGEGVYRDNFPNEVSFGKMVEAITNHLRHKVLYIEFSHFSHKMFGYRALRHEGYFPVRWMNIHISLHSRSPQERIQPKFLQHIENAMKRGITTRIVTNKNDFQKAMHLLRHHMQLKPRRYLPKEDFFKKMMQQGECTIMITCFREHVIGCSVTVHSDKDAYLWYSAALRKTYGYLRPHAVTIWQTILLIHQQGYDHIRFVDVGLPFRRSIQRDFILRFGGKEVSGYRWFRLSFRWLNQLASRLWRE